jgi:hypothetical protein
MISRGPPFARTLLLATLSAVTTRPEHCAAAVAATAAARSAVLQLSSVLSCRHAFASRAHVRTAIHLRTASGRRLPAGPAGQAEQGRGTCSVRNPTRAIAAPPPRAVQLAAMSPAGGMMGSVKRKAPANALAPDGGKRGKTSDASGEGAVEEGPDEAGLGAAEDNDEGAGPFNKGKASGYSAATELYFSKCSI